VGGQDLGQHALDRESRFERQGGFVLLAHGADPILNVNICVMRL